MLPKWERGQTDPTRIITRKAPKTFWEQHPDAEQPPKAWFKFARGADRKTPTEAKANDRNARFLADHRVRFDGAGNPYRPVVRVNYPYRLIYIRFVGTHAAYDDIDANPV